MLHFAGAFVLFGGAFTQASLLMVGPAKAGYARLARIDVVVGAGAVAVLAGGLLRVFYGARGADYYLENPAFHLKATLFVVVVLISIYPTITFIKWRRAAKKNPAFAPEPKTVKRVKMLIHIELTLLALIVFTASVMARWFTL